MLRKYLASSLQMQEVCQSHFEMTARISHRVHPIFIGSRSQNFWVFTFFILL